MSAGLFQEQDEKETSCRVAGMRIESRQLSAISARPLDLLEMIPRL